MIIKGIAEFLLGLLLIMAILVNIIAFIASVYYPETVCHRKYGKYTLAAITCFLHEEIK